MRILMISDLHYSTKPFHGLDESKSFEWLYGVIENEKPELTLSAGDFGLEADSYLFEPILEKTYLLTVYGNHDNIGLIKSLKNEDGSRCWLQDGVIREYNGLRIAGISGNIAELKRKPHHKTEAEIKQIISSYSGKRTDILITHEAPEHESISRGRMLGYRVINEAIHKIKPKLHLCGHVHLKSQILNFDETISVNLDSSARRREYCLAEATDGKIRNIKIKSYRRK